MRLIVGTGNPTRRDDGAGLEVVHRLSDLPIPQTECRGEQQLDTTLLEDLAQVELLLVVDADPKGRRVVLEKVTETLGSSSTHGLSPGALRGMCQALYGRSPEIWVCRLPARDFGFGEGFTEETQQAVGEAVERIQSFLFSQPIQAPPLAGLRSAREDSHA